MVEKATWVRMKVIQHLLSAVADEMGIVLHRSSCSPNIKERRDYSCGVFLSSGEMIAQAAHIPVHLGSMPLSVQTAVQHITSWEPGDVVFMNDPFHGGTHLPDVTVISPFFHRGKLLFFLANRAHHADIGGCTPGSMPIARDIYQEGIRIPPLKLIRKGIRNDDLWMFFLSNVRTPKERACDFQAQIHANKIGIERLKRLLKRFGETELIHMCTLLLEYSEKMMRAFLSNIPDGSFRFEDFLDDDGIKTEPLRIQVTLEKRGENVVVRFDETSPQCSGSVNAVYAVTLSAVRYCFRCLIPEDIPLNDGAFRPIRVEAKKGSLVHAQPPSAVSAGNVETSQRIVDVVFGALSHILSNLIPSASCGSMNNVTFGGMRYGQPFTFYETIAGGLGASPRGHGASAVHAHMTNTLNTPVEAIERQFPVRIVRYAVRRGSGGKGRFHGGDGIIREYEFLSPVTVSLITERRKFPPYGLFGGEPGKCGRNVLIRKDGTGEILPGKCTLHLHAGERIRIETPGGGGWGMLKKTHTPSD